MFSTVNSKTDIFHDIQTISVTYYYATVEAHPYVIPNEIMFSLGKILLLYELNFYVLIDCDGIIAVKKISQ